MLSVTSGFAVLIIAVMVATLAAVERGFVRAAAASAGAEESRRSAVRLVTPLLGGWLVLVVGLAAGGFFVTGPSEASRIAWALVPLALGIALLAASPGFRGAIDAVPPDRLVGVQVYRVLGGVFVAAWALGILPAVFALPAGLGDILVGVAAPLVAKNLRSGHPAARRLAIVWNIVGLADLVTAVTLGVLSAPGRLQRLSLDRPNVAISEFPFVIIPTVLVPLSILLHVFSLRSLTRSRSAAIPSGLARPAGAGSAPAA